MSALKTPLGARRTGLKLFASALVGLAALSTVSLATVQTASAASSTTTTITSSENPSNLGDTVMFTATVVGQTPTGSVSFYDGSVQLGSAPLALTSGNYEATFSTSLLTGGSHSVTADYPGDSLNAPSNSDPLTQLVYARQASDFSTTLNVQGLEGSSVQSVTMAEDFTNKRVRFDFFGAGDAPLFTVWEFFDKSEVYLAIPANGSAPETCNRVATSSTITPMFAWLTPSGATVTGSNTFQATDPVSVLTLGNSIYDLLTLLGAPSQIGPVSLSVEGNPAGTPETLTVGQPNGSVAFDFSLFTPGQPDAAGFSLPAACASPDTTSTTLQGAPLSGTVTIGSAFTGQLNASSLGVVPATSFTTTSTGGPVAVSPTGGISAPGTLPSGTYTVSGTDSDGFGFGTGVWSFTLAVVPGPVAGGSHLAATPDGTGYWVVGPSGTLTAHGSATNYGSEQGQTLNAPVVGIASTPDGRGYWLVAGDGGVFTFGDANFYGSMGGHKLNAPIVGLASSHDGRGYWLVASDGGVFSFGDANFYNSMGGRTLSAPVVGLAATPDGAGYWLVGADGGVFSFGDANFYGSTGALKLNAPVVGLAASLDGGGYWLVAADGGVFNFGDAPFAGSVGGRSVVPQAVIGLFGTNQGHGYTLVDQSGTASTF